MSHSKRETISSADGHFPSTNILNPPTKSTSLYYQSFVLRDRGLFARKEFILHALNSLLLSSMSESKLSQIRKEGKCGLEGAGRH